jgi:hypothetical protein
VPSGWNNVAASHLKESRDDLECVLQVTSWDWLIDWEELMGLGIVAVSGWKSTGASGSATNESSGSGSAVETEGMATELSSGRTTIAVSSGSVIWGRVKIAYVGWECNGAGEMANAKSSLVKVRSKLGGRSWEAML